MRDACMTMRLFFSSCSTSRTSSVATHTRYSEDASVEMLFMAMKKKRFSENQSSSGVRISLGDSGISPRYIVLTFAMHPILATRWRMPVTRHNPSRKPFVPRPRPAPIDMSLAVVASLAAGSSSAMPPPTPSGSPPPTHGSTAALPPSPLLLSAPSGAQPSGMPAFSESDPARYVYQFHLVGACIVIPQTEAVQANVLDSVEAARVAAQQVDA